VADTATNSNARTQGISLMVLSMALFAIADTFVKLASGTMTAGQVAFLIITGTTLVFTSLTLAQGHSLWHPGLKTPAVIGRAASEIIGTFGMITAFALAPLSTTIAILQASPLVVTALAAVFLNEAVGWRRWSAIAIGFVGVMLIIRPGTDGFDPALIWAVIGMLGLSARDFFTRTSPKDIPTTLLSAFTLASVVPFVLVWALVEGGTLIPPTANWIYVACMIGFGTGGYFTITLATRATELSVVAPFRYSRLIFAGALGIIVFGERLDIWMISGSILILGSGLFAAWRERTNTR